MKRRMKTLSRRTDFKLNATRCFSGTHAYVRFTRETFVDKRLPREACFDLGDVKVEMKRRMKTFSWRKDLKLNASRCFTGTHATVRFHQRSIRDKRFPREACFDLGDVEVVKEEDEDILVEELNAAWCFSGTLATVFFFFTETLVASDCRVKGALTRAMSKRREPL